MSRVRREASRLRLPGRADESLAIDVYRPAGAACGAALFMPGFGSNRRGEKAVAFGEAFARAGVALLAFDPRGHGESSGALEGLTLARHLEDLAAAWRAARAIHGRIVGIGSSLGGLALVAHAAAHPRAFVLLVGIGAAFGFHERWSAVPPGERPPLLTAAAIRSAIPLRTGRLAPRLRTPALLWHGARDDAVPWRDAARFTELAAAPVEMRLLGDGDHRLTSHKERIARESLARALEALAPAGRPRARLRIPRK